MIRIKNHIIGKDGVFVIAEVGVNHNGSFRVAQRMIDEAKEAGADAVKFQTYNTDLLVGKDTAKADYQKARTSGETQYDMLKKLELDPVAFTKLKQFADTRGIIFLSTPFDIESAKFLHKLKVPAFKIGSGDLTNTPLLYEIGQFKKPVILSTGMASEEEINQAINAIKSAGNQKIIILHCTTGYPAPFDAVGLKMMERLRQKHSFPVGFSDHTVGIEAAIAATALGATVIEKHFTIDKTMPGPDHRASIEPKELKEMVSAIRNIETALVINPQSTRNVEANIKKVARKSIFAACDIAKGQTITSEMLCVRRPETGLKPSYFNLILGKQAVRNIAKDEPFKKRMIEE